MSTSKNILITGGFGFIGSALIRYLINNTKHYIINVDAITYASNQDSLSSIENNPRYQFEHVNICDADSINRILKEFKPHIIMNLAAETHVDRSIYDPSQFIKTNIIGTYNLLEQARHYWESLPIDRKKTFRFHQISTDEVYGDLPHPDEFELQQTTFLSFTESSKYSPSSPYSASKASADHLVRAWYRTYGLPVVITNSSNNYGAFQHPEKLIPKTIQNALSGNPIPVYGNGRQIRDWLYVDDHVKALFLVATRGTVGETYNISAQNELKNIQVINIICDCLEEYNLAKPHGVVQYKDLITFINDRPGHDKRYSVDATKIIQELYWRPEESFETGIRKTILWYVKNQIDLEVVM